MRALKLHGRSFFFHLISISFLVVTLAGCATSGTRGFESADPLSRIEDKAKLPLRITDETVILDARSAFDYGLGHWSEAIHFPWQKLAESEQTGQLLKDPSKAGLSLSLVGIDPITPVIVVGEGPRGQGEEGRLAWTLLYYGLSDVQTVSQNGLDIFLTQAETKPSKNKPIWSRNPREELRIGREEFLEKVVAPRETKSGKVLFIDVRSKEEYFAKKGALYKEPDIQALHMEWKEFYQSDGRPDLKLKGRLQALGYSTGDEIIVFSNRGVRSSAAAYALIANGFRNVRNFIP